MKKLVLFSVENYVQYVQCVNRIHKKTDPWARSWIFPIRNSLHWKQFCPVLF